MRGTTVRRAVIGRAGVVAVLVGNRATVAGIKSSPKAGFYLRVKFNPAAFDLDRLSQSGE
jgi:hypothetical protein